MEEVLTGVRRWKKGSVRCLPLRYKDGDLPGVCMGYIVPQQITVEIRKRGF